MELDKIKQLIEDVEKSRLRKFILKQGDFELHLEKEAEHVQSMPVQLPPSYHPPRPQAISEHPADHFHKDGKGHRKIEEEGKFVSSPMVGTFYASQSPDQPPLIKIGDRISENTVVCIIEAMKVMNEVKAGVSGTVAEVLIDNAHPVEFGTKLFRIV